MNLNTLGVQEMNANEMQTTDGGIWPILVGVLISELLDRDSPSDFAEGFADATR